MILSINNCYTEFIGVLGSQDSVSDPPSRVKMSRCTICLLDILTLQDATETPACNVSNEYQQMLRKIPKQQRPQLHCGNSLKSQLLYCLCDLCSFAEGKEICLSILGAKVQFHILRTVMS
jgi:hypothetical protein